LLVSDGGFGSEAEARGKLRSAVEQFRDDVLDVLIVEPRHRSRHAQRRDDLAGRVADRNGQAADPFFLLLVVQGVSPLARFLELGFIIFTAVPTGSKTVLQAASAFGFVRDTNFGAYFDVRSVPDANDLAYTSIFLDPHTDNPYRSPVPGVQLLHCLVNETSGGLSTLVDGFAAAEALRAQDPDAFGILARTPVRFRFRDTDTELVRSAPLIELDGAWRVEAVNFSPRLDYVPLLRPQELAAYFGARKAFDHLLRSPQFEIRFLLESGDLMMMDNRRLLHGRTAFDPREGLRHLQGCYIDLDGPRSQYRVLRRRLATSGSLA